MGITVIRYLVLNHQIKTEISLLNYLKKHKRHLVYRRLNGEKSEIKKDKVNFTIRYVSTIKKYNKEFREQYPILKDKLDSKLFLSAKSKKGFGQ